MIKQFIIQIHITEIKKHIMSLEKLYIKKLFCYNLSRVLIYSLLQEKPIRPKGGVKNEQI